MFFYVSINERIRGGLRTYFYISKIFNGMKQERKYGGVTTVNATEPKFLLRQQRLGHSGNLICSHGCKRRTVSVLWGENVVLVRTK